MSSENSNFNMTPDEKIAAVTNLKQDMEENFVQLGQLLSDIRRTKLFKFKGYKNFKEFVENEFNMSGSFAAKIISNFDLFIRELDVDEHSVKEIGLDKLNLIKPLVKQAEFNEKDDWIKKAQELPTSELREEIKEIRENKKNKDKTMKDVFIEQYVERLVTFFNCNRKELNFKLALYFQDEDLEEMRAIIKNKQRKFEETDQL
ncbi:MAG: hypothetical protein RAP70_11705 [Candidatus Celaenobacter antarcticus]|nr:hypothetical protein [Candidatus Tenebribacter davisii]MDP8315713.1 hypothetical protein [Candidatus Celaenobacter antarcticus]